VLGLRKLFLGDFEDVGKEEEAQLVALAAQLVGAAQLNDIDFADKTEKQFFIFNGFYFNY
jgi:hypothetical protein